MDIAIWAILTTISAVQTSMCILMGYNKHITKLDIGYHKYAARLGLLSLVTCIVSSIITIIHIHKSMAL